MALGITRAADRVAVWHEAASGDEIFEVPEYESAEPATSTPPKGATPPSAGQDVVIPNSNKFKTPANGLKKLLDAMPGPEAGFHPQSSQALDDWLNKKPDFTKTYFKPQYNEALKAHIGEANHAKLMHHAPTPWTDALTIHQQQPAPKSNKFTTPANGLKKLLEHPDTKTEHVTAWIDKHPGFAKTYLDNPGYEQAIKGHLGEKNYGELKKHLEQAEKPSILKPMLDKLGPGFKQMDTEEFFGPNGPAPPGSGPAPKPQEWASPMHVDSHNDLVENSAANDEGMYDQLFQSPDFKKWWTTLDSDQTHHYVNNAKDAVDDFGSQKLMKSEGQPQSLDDANAHGLVPKEPKPYPSDAELDAAGITPEPPNAGQEITPKEPKPGVQHPALVQAIGKVFPNSDVASGEHDDAAIKKQLETWLKYLPEHEGFNDHVPKLQKIYDQFFGGKGQGPSAPSPEPQPEPSGSFSQAMEKALGQNPGAFAALDAKPAEEKKQFLDYYYKTEGLASKGHPELAKLYEHPDIAGGGQGGAANQHEQNLQTIKDALSYPSGDYHTDLDDYKAWEQSLSPDFAAKLAQDPAAAKADFEKHLEGYYGDQKDDDLEPADMGYGDEAYTQEPFADQAWQALHDLGTDVDKPTLQKFTPAQKKEFLDYWIKNQSIVPGTKAALEHLYDHPEVTGGSDADEISQIQKGLGGDPWGSDAPGMTPKQVSEAEPLQEWEQELLEPPKQGLGDKLQAVKAGFSAANWNEFEKNNPPGKVKAHLQQSIDYEKNHDPEVAEKLQQVLDEHFGGVSQADQHAAFKKYFSDPLDLESKLYDFFGLVGTGGLTQQFKNDAAKAVIEQNDFGDIPAYLKSKYPYAYKKWIAQHGDARPQVTTSVPTLDVPQSVFQNEVPLPLMEGGYDAKAPYKWAPGAQAWLAEKGITSPEDVKYGKLEQLYNDWYAMSDEDKQHYIDLEQGGGTAPSAQPTFDAKSFAADMGKIFGLNPEIIKSDGKLMSEMTPQEAQTALKSLTDTWGKNYKGNGTSLQKIFDKHFGEGAQAQSQPTEAFPLGTQTPTAEQLQAAGLPFANASQIANQSPKKFHENYNYVKEHAGDFDDQSMWSKIVNWVDSQQGGGAPAQQADSPWYAATQAYGKKFEGIKGGVLATPAFKEWFHSLSPADQEKFGTDPQQNYANMFKWKSDGSGNYTDAYKKAKEEWMAGKKAPSSTSAPDWDTIKAQIAKPLADVWNVSTSNTFVQSVVNATPEEAKKLLEQKMTDWGGPTSEKGQQIKAILDQVTGASAAPAALPAWDWSKFGPEFQALFPKSEWAKSSDPGAANAQDKLKAAVESAKANFPGTQKTQQAEDLYKKYFGNGLPAASAAPAGGGSSPASSGLSQSQLNQLANISAWSLGTASWSGKSPEQQKNDLQALIQEHNQEGYHDEAAQLSQLYSQWFGNPFAQSAPEPEAEPEETEGVSTPYKTEEPNPQELSMWAADKPDSPEEWKNFASWWGKTQLTPEQESAIYGAWFPHKAGVTPEKANAWFSKVFEFHSKPGKGDLGATDIPAWAHNSWAFGKNAEKEWPVFSVWAAKHPGLGKDLSVKQKLAIWKGLSAGDKKAVAEDYLPETKIDTNAAVAALQKAYPDSDFSKWAQMGQGTLAANVETLAKAGYNGAIPVYNQFFGGNIPLPKADKTKADKEKKTGPTSAVKIVPIDKMPEWAQNNWGNSEASAKNYSEYKHFADLLGKGDIAEKGKQPGESYYDNPSTKLQKLWNGIPNNLKAQINTMKAAPFSDEATFQTWFDAQPKLKDQVAQAMGLPSDHATFNSAIWNYPNSYMTNKAQALGSYIDKETDPIKKQNLLNLYHEHFGNGKETVSQALGAIYPKEDWDKFLKTHTSDQIVAEIKKRLKKEPDPEKFVGLVDTLGKYFSKPGDPYNVANSGMGVVTNALKSHSPGNPVDTNVLKQLHYWKANGIGGTSLPSYWSVKDHTSPYLEAKAAKGETGGYPLYHGWMPPGEATSGTFTADPALLASPTASYTAPEAGPQGKHYQALLDKMDKNTHAYGPADKELAKSEEFAQWFASAPTPYKAAFQHNPGIALDDFKSFMAGELGTDVPEGEGGKTTYYDVSPFANIPTPQSKGLNKHMPPSLLYRPQRDKSIKFPSEPDAQETLPLGQGAAWSPNYNPMPIYRLMTLPLDQEPTVSDNVPASMRKMVKEQQRARLNRIDELINGTNKARNTDQDKQYLKNFAQNKGLDQKAINELTSILFPAKPEALGTDDKWKHFEDFAKKHGLAPSDMTDLAQNVGVMSPPQAKGNYEHPELANLLLDYMEASGYNGLGIHWTRDKDKVYEGISAAGLGKGDIKPSQRKLQVLLHGRWGGQGEGSGEGGAYSAMDNREREHNLMSGAPVNIHRVQLRDPDGDLHDLMDYGPISLWPEGRNETATNKEVLDKPSLAKTLNQQLGGKKFPKEFWDSLKPGHQADILFNKLVGEYPDKKDQINKIYRWFFVGRPDLPTKPHKRHAAVVPPPRALRDVEAAIDLLAYAWDDDDPDHNGDDEETWDDDDEGTPVEDYATPVGGFGTPMFPEGQGQRPLLPGGDYKFYYSPHEINPPSASNARPDVLWDMQDFPQQPLPLDDPDYHPQGADGWPRDRQPMPMYRGMMLDLTDPGLAHVRRALLGGEYEDPKAHGALESMPGDMDLAAPHPQGYSDKSLGEHILNHVQENNRLYGGEKGGQYGLGPHWSTNPSKAGTFAGIAGVPTQLPVRLKAEWKGQGEDPYRTNTQGSWPDEKEITMLPGNNMNVTSVQIRHPKTHKWHEVLDKPSQRSATVRRPTGILTVKERYL